MENTNEKETITTDSDGITKIEDPSESIQWTKSWSAYLDKIKLPFQTEIELISNRYKDVNSILGDVESGGSNDEMTLMHWIALSLQNTLQKDEDVITSIDFINLFFDDYFRDKAKIETLKSFSITGYCFYQNPKVETDDALIEYKHYLLLDNLSRFVILSYDVAKQSKTFSLNYRQFQKQHLPRLYEFIQHLRDKHLSVLTKDLLSTEWIELQFYSIKPRNAYVVGHI